MKKILFLLIFLVPLVSAALDDECKGTITNDEVPCQIFLDNSNCSAQDVTFFFNGSTQLDTRSMDTYNPFLCNQTFNYSTLGTYSGNYTSGDAFTIIVEEGNKLILLLYFSIALLFGLLILGMTQQDPMFTAISGIGFVILGVWMAINGFSVLNNLVTQGISIIFIGVGSYIFIRTGMDSMKA